MYAPCCRAKENLEQQMAKMSEKKAALLTYRKHVEEETRRLQKQMDKKVAALQAMYSQLLENVSAHTSS